MKKTFLLLSAILLIALLTSCGGSTGGATKVSVTSTTTNPLGKCLEDLRPLVRQWNTVSATMLAAYTNQNVSASDTITVFDANLPTLTQTVATMKTASVPCKSDSLISTVLETYEQKLSGYTALRNALVIRSATAEQDAITALKRANDLSLSTSCTFLEKLGEPKPSTCP